MSNPKRALVTGITGQDGMYLAELLLSKNYEVYGLIRGQHNPKRSEVEREIPGVRLIEGDLTDMGSILRAFEESQPDEVYNLGAISFVKLSFDQPEITGNISGLGVTRILEAVRIFDGGKGNIRFYQASTSEMFGGVQNHAQSEKTPFYPRSPYGAAKLYGHFMTINYRESYGIHASCGILFNHESPRRGYEFVTRKVTSSVARIKLGLQDKLVMGNLDAKRDWGFAGDYVRGMWMMMQQDKPDDYVLGTGETHSIKELLDVAFAEAGIKDWKPYVVQDKRFMRPAEVDMLLADPAKANKQLGWKPEVNFQQLISRMVKNDLEIEGAKQRR